MNFSKFFIIFFLTVGLAPVASAELNDSECRQLRTRMTINKRQLMEWADLKGDLEEKYHAYVAEDFKAQADGVMNTLARNKAMKVVFARKRLNQSIAQAELSMSSAKQQYCKVCTPDFSAPLKRAEYCELCGFRKECKRLPASASK